jgi:hypothetical protein
LRLRGRLSSRERVRGERPAGVIECYGLRGMSFGFGLVWVWFGLVWFGYGVRVMGE